MSFNLRRGKTNTTHIRISQEDKIKFNQIKVDLTKIRGSPISDTEMNRRIMKTKIRERLIKDQIDFPEPRKKRFGKLGIAGPIISIFIMLGVIALIMLVFFIFGLVGPQISDTFNTITVTLQESTVEDSAINNATDQTFGNINPGFQNLQWISYTLLVFLFIGFLFLAFFVRAYPFLIIFWLGGMLVLIVSAIFLSSAYVDISSSSLSSTYEAWGTNHFLMSNLPQIFTVMGFLGGFILFVIVSRDTEVESSAI